MGIPTAILGRAVSIIVRKCPSRTATWVANGWPRFMVMIFFAEKITVLDFVGISLQVVTRIWSDGFVFAEHQQGRI